MTMILQRRERGGFTLPELLVSVFIFGMLATLVIANFRSSGYDQELRTAAEQLASNLRRMQNLSLSGFVYAREGSGFTGTPPGGFGLYIYSAGGLPTRQYKLFADFTSRISGSNNCPGPSGDNVANHLYDSGAGCDPLVERETVDFSSNLYFSNICAAGRLLDVTPANTNNAGYHTLFVPPNALPIVTYDDNDPREDPVSGTGIILELYHTVTEKKRIVTLVGSAGQISESLGAIDPLTCAALTGGG